MPPKKKKQTDEERLKKKREAEKKRQDRIRANPELLVIEREKRNAKYKKRKEKGQVKLVKDMSGRELRLQRKEWRHKQQKHRKKAKETKNLQEYMEANSPPESVDGENNNPAPEVPNNTIKIDGRSLSGKKRARNARSKMYRELQKYKDKFIKSEQKANKYRKKYERILNKTKNAHELTPQSKINKLLKEKNICDKEVKRRLVFGEVVQSSIAKHYSKIKSIKEKQDFRKFICAKVIKKYKIATMTKKLFHFHCSTKTVSQANKRNIIESKKRLEVKKFLEMNDNSTLAPGKKDTVTRGKVKKQIRYLNDSLQSLHDKFKKNSSIIISYAGFCKKKPFWIVKPNANKRDTCLCLKHSNMAMLAGSMYHRKLIDLPLKKVIERLTCSSYSEECLLRKCEKCKENIVLYNEFNHNDTITYQKWVTVKESRIVKGVVKVVTLTKKETLTVNIETIIEQFEKSIPIYMKHLAAIHHQFKFMKHLKENLNHNEAVIHMDFSENFSCKYNEEVQSIHFGASRSQVTIHTGVAYFLNKEEDPTKFCFASISQSLRHDPPAVWAHLEPVLNEVFLQNSKITIIHFISDSPTTQYRNKNNFFLFNNLNNMFPKLIKASWNFSEAGHGKGAPDGVGAVLKRTADQLIAEGTDIKSADEFFNVLAKQNLNVKIYKVNDNDIEKHDKTLLEVGTLKPITGTMSIRQVTNIYKPKHVTDYRTLSCCRCGLDSICPHYRVLTLNNQQKTNVSKKRGFCNEQDDNPSKRSKQSEVEDKLTGTMNVQEKYKIHDFVIVAYEGEYFPGQVKNIRENTEYGVGMEYLVSAMTMSGPNGWRWPIVEDIIWYDKCSVLEKIPPPSVTNSRGVCTVQSINKYRAVSTTQIN